MGNFAAVDVGSNQVLLFISKVESGRSGEVILDKGEITKLGEDVSNTGVLKADAMKRTLDALKDFKGLIEKNNVEEYAAVGTAALRESNNSDEFLNMVRDETGIQIEIITGEEEARLSFLAVVGGLNLGNRETVIIDIGGGSTEFIFGKQAQILDRFSLKIGALKMTERFLHADPVRNEEFNEMTDHLNDEFKHVSPPFKELFLVGMGGTMSNLGAMKYKLEKYDPGIVHGSEISLGELNSIMIDLKEKTVEERKKIRGLQPKRAGVMLAGTGILKAIMNKLHSEKITISDMGLRHGLMFDRFCK